MSEIDVSKNVLERGIKLLQKEGVKSFWFKLLSEIGCYRRLLLLERSLEEPIPEIMPHLPITIRLLKKAEVDEYLKFRPKSNPSRIAHRLNANHWCFVAHHDGLIISASWAVTQRAWNFYLGAEIQVALGDIYVYDSFTMLDFRGQSISPAIRAEMIRYFRAAGYQRMIMGVIPENKPSLRAVLKTGFRPFGMMGWIKIGPWQWDFYRTINVMIKSNPKSKLWAELAWWLYEHLPAEAADDIMNWCLRCTLPFRNLRVPIFFVRGITPINKRKGTLLVAGKKPGLNYLVRRFFEGEIQQEMVGEVPLWKLSKTLKRLRTSADLTIVHIDHLSAKLLFDSSYLIVPTWVDLVLKAPEEPEKIARGNRSLKNDLRIVRRNKLTFDISRSESDFEMFYHTMYKPFILNRHGEYAGIRGFRLMHRMFRQGGLQWILRNGEPIAGRVFQRQGKVFKFVSHGMVNGEWSNVKAGATAALYFFGILYAKKTGCRLIDLGRCRPSLSDGVLRYKRKWGAGLNKNDIELNDLLVYWNGFSEPISSFLTHTPLIFRDHDELSAIHVIDTAGQTDVSKTSRSMWIPGLRRLYLVSASGGGD